jgi:hypothetical protein
MDIILDTMFYVLYFLKGINLALAYISLYLTERLFSELYMKKVYGLEKEPPSLHYFLWILILIHFCFNVFLVIFMLLLLYMFNKEGKNNFFINGFVIKTYIMDLIVVYIVLGLIAVIVASIMQKKRYFRYRTEGLRAIRGYKEILFYCSILIIILPYFYFMI